MSLSASLWEIWTCKSGVGLSKVKESQGGAVVVEERVKKDLAFWLCSRIREYYC
jgi:hypothetical protein